MSRYYYLVFRQIETGKLKTVGTFDSEESANEFAQVLSNDFYELVAIKYFVV